MRTEILGNQSPPEQRSRSTYSGEVVRIIDHDLAKHALKVVKINNQKLVPDQKIEGSISQEKLIEIKQRKFLKTSNDPIGPIIEVSNSEASIRGSDTSGIITTAKHGTIISGPLSITAQPHEIRLSLMTKLNPLITSGFASTIATPIPMTILSMPGVDAMFPIAKEVAIMASLLSIGGI